MPDDQMKSAPGASQDDEFFVAAPQPSLPKGGGAIRGIGEKFSANPVTGTGSLSVPVYSSPGRSGFGPQLSLSYDSGKGNTPFGFGWSLNSASITRKTDKGLPRFRDFEESDLFILAGAEDLTPSLVCSDGAWSREVLRRSVHGAEYTIHRYRPRVESGFARIERWASLLDPQNTFWRTISKDNITTWYGKTAASRIADPEDPSHIFSWLICETSDDRGNVVLFGYKPEDSTGVDLSEANERNRSDITRSAQRYLKRVQYGNRTPYYPDLSAAEPTPLPEDWCFELVFDYGEHDQAKPLPTEDRPWVCRPDSFSEYRATFEVRTYRLCRRVLMFHHFPEEVNIGLNCLVRSTDLVHANQAPEDPAQPFYSYLLAAKQTGHVRNGDAEYLSRSLPPLEFAYTPAIVDETVRQLSQEDLENLPSGIDGDRYRWVDLDGEGVSGILTEEGGSWYYKPNLSPANERTIDGAPYIVPRFGPTQLLAREPSLADLSGRQQQFMDLAGDGRLDLVQFSGTTPGFYERTADQNWEPFTPFESLPVVDWRNPKLKFIDLTGDGLPDLLISEDDAFWWHAGLGNEGFGAGHRVPQALDEERGPQLIFTDSTEAVFLADMSGDGLTDLVRVRRGEVVYWPNLGYGRFGPKVTMDASPGFEFADIFDGDRIRMADIDGSGTADLIYFGSESVHLYFNQSGNGWGAERKLRNYPPVESVSSAAAMDLLGDGTACLVWSSPLPANAGRQMRYIRLMGGQKPHLLTRLTNNMGAETRIQYVPSTKFYVADKLAGTPWVTRLPMPVHVVERLEQYDFISRNRFVTRFAYHHGYYDGVEREFRGFGRVDRWDTEEMAVLSNSSDFPEARNAAFSVPPLLTKMWFHTGAFFGEARISRHMKHEYYQEGEPSGAAAGLSRSQLESTLLEDTVLPTAVFFPNGTHAQYSFSGEELREACRALCGRALRQEIYALDGKDESDRPYSVSESNYTIEAFQPQGPNRYGAFFAHARETIDYHYERKLYRVLEDRLAGPDDPPARIERRADPRVQHTVTLTVDYYANVLQTVAIAYGRRYRDPALSATDQLKQTTLLTTYAANAFTNPVLCDDAYRTPLAAESTSYELLQLQPDAYRSEVTNLFRFEELKKKIACAGDGKHDIAFEDGHPAGLTHGEPYRRRIGCKRVQFRPDDMGAVAGDSRALLPLGRLEPLALQGRSYRMAFTPGLISQVYQRGGSSLLPSPADVLGRNAGDGGGYIDLDGDGHWWISSGRKFQIPVPDDPATEAVQARNHFFLPRRFENPFGSATLVDYDAPYDLLIAKVVDAVGNATTSANDYRVLQAFQMTDPNGNRGVANFDALGLVAGTAIMGKPTEQLGDVLSGFRADLSQEEIDSFYQADDPHTVAAPLLGNATARVVYDPHRFMRSRAAAPDDPLSWEPAFAATLARETHLSDLAPGQQTAIQIGFTYSDGYGRAIQNKSQAEPGPAFNGGPVVDPRWIGSGWTIFDNKARPIRKYEPFYSQLRKGHQFEFGVQIGVSPIVCYDPAGRVVATIQPNHSYSKVVFDPWQQQSWDVNDTVLQNDPAQDSDVSEFFELLPESDYLPTWYTERVDGALGPLERAAAAKAAAHANTPAAAYFDTLGRLFRTVADNGDYGRYASHSEFDIQGNECSVRDPLERKVMVYRYDMLQRRIHQASMEAGEQWILADCIGKSIGNWDNRGHNFRTCYDARRRMTERFVLGTSPAHSDPRTLAAEVLFERVEYGEGKPDDRTLNLRNHVFRAYDTGGIALNVGHNPATGLDEGYDFKGNLLRSSRQFVQDYKALPDWSATAPVLQAEVFGVATRYDALNRPTAVSEPDGSIFRPSYDKASQLKAMDVNLRGSAELTRYVTDITYNARGQRILIEYGNSTSTESTWDPLTFRQTCLLTTRTTRASNERVVQNLSYTYDPAGNITHLRDDAQDTVFFRNRRVDPTADYTYDPIYRLIQASGREKLQFSGGGPLPPSPTSYNDVPRTQLLLPGDGDAMGLYTERYEYDPVGNFLKFAHRGSDPANPGWTRNYAYQEASTLEAAHISNRLTSTTIDGNIPLVEKYDHDVEGSMTRMPQLQEMQWDFKGALRMTRRQAINAEDQSGVEHEGERTFYVYHSSGKRVRKTTESPGKRKVKERFYLDGYEVYREFDSAGEIALERETLHLMDDKRRVALVETKTIDGASSATSLPSTTTRYQLDNQLGTACLELDETAAVITYEEYYPFGGTSFQAGRTHAEVSLKRYRYTGKERDEETGFYYHTARYYAPWLGRWTSTDPKGLVDGTCLYEYSNNDPISLRDPSGTETKFVMTGLIANDPKIGATWEQSVVESLGKDFGTTTYKDTVEAFQKEVNRLIAANGGNPGSNKAAGTAINYARRMFNRVRSKFKGLLQKEGIALNGQIHHAFEELAEHPVEAVNTTNLMLARGQAAVQGTGHNFAHQVADAQASGAKNPGQQVAADLEKKGIKPDVPELSHTNNPSTAPSNPAPESNVANAEAQGVKTEVKELTETGETALVRSVENETAKEGGKMLGEKAAKAVPFVGVGVAAGLVANDLRKGDYGAAAWDTGEGIPGVGDAVMYVHLWVQGVEEISNLPGQMYEGQRQRDVEEFYKSNPGATPEDFDRMQKTQEDFNNGTIWDNF